MLSAGGTKARVVSHTPVRECGYRICLSAYTACSRWQGVAYRRGLYAGGHWGFVCLRHAARQIAGPRLKLQERQHGTTSSGFV
jgi:hypothetical protein